MQEKPQSNIIEDLLLWQRSLAKMAGDIFSLAALETRLAGKSLVAILGFFLAYALLLTVAWIFLMLGLAFWLISLGVGVPASFAIAGVLNIFLAFISLLLIKKHRQNLNFPATRRQLSSSLHENT